MAGAIFAELQENQVDYRTTEIETEFDEQGNCTYLVMCFVRDQREPVDIQRFSELADARKFTRRWCNGTV